MPARHRSDQESTEVGELGVVPLATFGARIGARLCDLATLFVPTYLVVGVILGGSAWTVAYMVAIELVVYDALLSARTGATPGKRIARIKVVALRTGTPPGFGKSALRALTLGVLGWLIHGVFVLFDERTHRGLHDRAVGTVVIAV
jgi:uncharacterized RDD family membrane protein YckC